MDGLSQKENILSIKNCTLVNNKNAAAIAERIYNLQQYRIEQSFSVIPEAGVEKPGMAVAVENEYNENRNAYIESMKIDLYNGLLTKITTKGV